MQAKADTTLGRGRGLPWGGTGKLLASASEGAGAQPGGGTGTLFKGGGGCYGRGADRSPWMPTQLGKVRLEQAVPALPGPFP